MLLARGHEVEVVTTADRAPALEAYPVHWASRSLPRGVRHARAVQLIAAAARRADVVYSTGMLGRSALGLGARARADRPEADVGPGLRALDPLRAVRRRSRLVPALAAGWRVRALRSAREPRAAAHVADPDPERVARRPRGRAGGSVRSGSRCCRTRSQRPASLEDRDELRRRLGLDGPTLVFAGRLTAQKSLDVALEALTRVDGRRPRARGRRAGRREARARWPASSGSTGARASSARSRERRCFELLSRRGRGRCSRRSGRTSRTSLVEALAVGTPVIATAAGGVDRGRPRRRERAARRARGPGGARRRDPALLRRRRAPRAAPRGRGRRRSSGSPPSGSTGVWRSCCARLRGREAPRPPRRPTPLPAAARRGLRAAQVRRAGERARRARARERGHRVSAPRRPVHARAAASPAAPRRACSSTCRSRSASRASCCAIRAGRRARPERARRGLGGGRAALLAQPREGRSSTCTATGAPRRGSTARRRVASLNPLRRPRRGLGGAARRRGADGLGLHDRHRSRARRRACRPRSRRSWTSSRSSFRPFRCPSDRSRCSSACSSSTRTSTCSWTPGARVAAQVPNASLRLIGAGAREDLARTLVERGPNVTWESALAPEEVVDELDAATCLVLPSRREGHGPRRRRGVLPGPGGRRRARRRNRGPRRATARTACSFRSDDADGLAEALVRVLSNRELASGLGVSRQGRIGTVVCNA